MRAGTAPCRSGAGSASSVLVAGALVGAGGSFSGDSLAGAAGLLAVVEGGLVVVTTLSMLLSG